MRPWLPIAYFGLTPVVGGYSPACVTTFLAQVHDPAGITFTVVRTDCEIIAKDSAVYITAVRDNEQGSILLLKYDPWTHDLPHVHVGSDDSNTDILTIRISEDGVCHFLNDSAARRLVSLDTGATAS
jgi:hypothetical protein